MTGFNTQVGGGMYRLQLETDRREVYNCVQNVIRCFMGTEHSEQVVVSKNENTTVAEDSSACVMYGSENTKEAASS